jgi:glycosyltransferase involved in cell wall biosynthesis
MRSRRVTVVASEILGIAGAGGPATADSLLALALGRRGHDVELLVAPGRDVAVRDADWERRYADSNVRVRAVPASTPVEPSFLAPAWHVHEALRDDPPEVVVADDWRALGYAALRSRQLGASLPGTAVVLYCHGPARVFTEAARKVPDTVARYGEEVAQRACVELADVIVSPSAWLVGWLREHGWPLRDDVRVIQNLWESVALAEPARRLDAGAPIRRLVFFGQLREGKGIGILLDAVRRLDESLLEGVELLFLGHTRQWSESRVAQELGPAASRLAAVRVEPSLGRTAAIDELLQPGTLALMPSLLENSPYAVAECLEHGIPFLATDVGGTPELVAEDDRARVLLRPDADDFASALSAALRSSDGVAPARAARDPAASLADWLDVVESVEAPARAAGTPAARVDVIACGERAAAHARTLGAEVIPATSRTDGLVRAKAEWVLFLEDDDRPDAGLLEALVAAQAASGADVVTTAVRTSGGVRLFLGDPGALGLLENHYGVVGLIRASLADGDSDWRLFTRIALEGGRILSLPTPLSTYEGPIATVGDVPGEGVEIVRAWEQAGQRAGLAQLAATLGAELARRAEPAAAVEGVKQGLRRLAARAGGRRG